MRVRKGRKRNNKLHKLVLSIEWHLVVRPGGGESSGFSDFYLNYGMERFIHYHTYGTRVTFDDPVVLFREQEWATRERDLAQLEWLVRERGESLGSLLIRCFLGVVLFKKCHGKNDRIPAEKRRQFRLYRLRCAIPALLLLRMLMRQRQSFHSASRFIIRRDHRI
jgi:hypothetical protein